MSIIRSNIARQLLAEGGAPRRKGFMFGSGKGSTAESMSEATFSPDTFSGFSGDYGGFSSPAGGSGPAPDSDPNTMDDTRTVNLGLDVSRGPVFTEPDPDDDRGFFAALSNPGKALSIRYIENELERRKNFENTFAGKLGFKPNEKPFDDKFLTRTQELEAALNLAKRGIDVTDIIQKGRPGYDPDRTGDSEPVIKLRAPITEKIEEEKPKKSEIENLLAFRGSAFEDGGEVRQEFGIGGSIGKVFKKAKKAVKKVAKSPIGKVALLAGLNYAPALFGKQTILQGLGKNQMFKKLFLKDAAKDFAFSNLNPFSAITAASLAAGALSKQDEDDDEKLPETVRSDQEFQDLINFYGGQRRFAKEGGDIEDAPKKEPSGIMMASNVENQEILESLFEKYLEMGLSPKDAADKARQEFDQMSKAKESDRMMANKGGLMNLGGNEMDLRGGGFVPIGAKEKADDVPARLSKNEFVFTADAVRAAGGGSVDRGADIMYKTMKNLENKVA